MIVGMSMLVTVTMTVGISDEARDFALACRESQSAKSGIRVERLSSETRPMSAEIGRIQKKVPSQMPACVKKARTTSPLKLLCTSLSQSRSRVSGAIRTRHVRPRARIQLSSLLAKRASLAFLKVTKAVSQAL